MMILDKDGGILGWHFLTQYSRPYYGTFDQPLTVGTVLHVSPPVTCRDWGLHACHRLLNALWFAPGTILCRVKLWGQIDSDPADGLVCATDREILGMMDTSSVLLKILKDNLQLLPAFKGKESSAAPLLQVLLSDRIDVAKYHEIEKVLQLSETSAEAVAEAILAGDIPIAVWHLLFNLTKQQQESIMSKLENQILQLMGIEQ